MALYGAPMKASGLHGEEEEGKHGYGDFRFSGKRNGVFFF